MIGRLRISLAILFAGASLVGASALASPAADVPKGGTLRLARFSDVDFIDPALAYASWSWPIEYATCAKLFNYPDADGAAGTRLVPEVVDRFTVSKDRRTYTFTLKQTYRFHTGARVTAQSFADAFNRNAQPRLRSPATAFMREIGGAQAVIDGTRQTISGIRVLDRYRLQIRLTRPSGDFIARLTMPFFCPILPNTPVDPGGIDNPPGSGPYYVAERVPNQRIVLARNPFYRGNRPANVEQVVFTVGVPQQDCLIAVEEDRIDHCLVLGIPTSAYPRLAEKYGINQPGGQFFVGSRLNTWFLAFNHDRPAFKGPGQIPLKKAINHAIDRPEMARAFGYLSKRTDQMLPPALARGERIYAIRGADPTTARNWFERAKIKPKELVLYAGNSPAIVAVAQVLVFNLKQLGIDVEVKFFEFTVLTGKVATRGEPFDIATLGWLADYPDGAAFFFPLLGRGSAVGLNVDDPRVQRRIAAADRLTGDARRNAWAELDVALMRDDPPWAPYVHTQTRVFVSRSTGCVLVHPVYDFDIAAACKK